MKEKYSQTIQQYKDKNGPSRAGGYKIPDCVVYTLSHNWFDGLLIVGPLSQLILAMHNMQAQSTVCWDLHKFRFTSCASSDNVCALSYYLV